MMWECSSSGMEKKRYKSNIYYSVAGNGISILLGLNSSMNVKGRLSVGLMNISESLHISLAVSDDCCC